MRKKLENFDIILGKIAITKTSRNKVPLIEVAYTNDDNIRGLFTYTDCSYVCGNIPECDIIPIRDRVIVNKQFLEV